MKLRILTGLLISALAGIGPSFAANRKPDRRHPDRDMQRAIAFERYKDLAAARQARKEARHPSVTYSNADRSVNRPEDANRVVDPGPKR